MARVLDWARENKMTVNLCSGTGLRRPNRPISDDLIPSATSDVRRVGAAKLLGVHLKQNLNFSQHVDAVVTTCNQRLYLLPQLKRQNLDILALDLTVFKTSSLILRKHKPEGAVQLRDRGHHFALPLVQLDFNKKTLYCLFIVIYCTVRTPKLYPQSYSRAMGGVIGRLGPSPCDRLSCQI